MYVCMYIHTIHTRTYSAHNRFCRCNSGDFKAEEVQFVTDVIGSPLVADTQVWPELQITDYPVLHRIKLIDTHSHRLGDNAPLPSLLSWHLRATGTTLYRIRNLFFFFFSFSQSGAFLRCAQLQ